MSLQERLQKYMADLDREVLTHSHPRPYFRGFLALTVGFYDSWGSIHLSFNLRRKLEYQRCFLHLVLDSLTFSLFSLIMGDKSFRIWLASFFLVSTLFLKI